jgi:hypothetical protein
VRLLDEEFEAIERNERELDAALQRSEALRQAILKKAFSGRLVPQDPADPPATNLLARTETWHAEKNPDGRWRKFTHAELVGRDKTSLDLFWLKDDSLADLDNLPEPEILAEEIIENIEAGLANFRTVANQLTR